jgi:hypothetical protein
MALNVPKDNGKVTGTGHDQGKGSLTIPPNDGDVIRDYGAPVGDVRGEDVGSLRDAGSDTGKEFAWLEGRSLDKDATNSLGSIAGDCKSDAMFDKFASDVRESKSEAAESVSGRDLIEGGAKSDPQAKELADEQALGPGAPKSTSDDE